MSLTDWVVCPESSCERSEDTRVRVADHGVGGVHISFHCENCEYGSLDDDLRWWVRCPNCREDTPSPVDSIDAEVTENGEISFTCNDCGNSLTEYPNSRWDAE